MNRKCISKLVVVILTIGLVLNKTPTRTLAVPIDPQQGVTVEKAVLDEIDAKGRASYWIEFDSDVDLSPAYLLEWNERGWFVYKTLKEHAIETQAEAISYLQFTNTTFTSFWIANRILVTNADRLSLSRSMRLPNVFAITAQREYFLHQPDVSSTSNQVMYIEPNIAHVQAPEAWSLGYDGTGLVVANIDTGVRYTHDALTGAYRGNDGAGKYSHDYNWFDPYGTYSAPADRNGHGTHTMGIMVGNDGGSNKIGIAPGAEWIACRGCGSYNCGDAELLACAQFIAAPTDLTGANPDPDLRPNAVNNSWGDCGTTYDPWFAGVIEAWHAAGVYPVFSNGNASNCGYSSPPGLNTVGNPARSGNVTGVGSSGQQDGQYATHSNWGPTDNLDAINPIDDYEMLKPQVLAPGVYIRSALNSSNTAYGFMSGTSMSAPHVSGLVALIMQAGPCLVGNYDVVENIIESTATDIVYDDGSSLTPSNFPNLATGWGEINALAAVTSATNFCNDYGTLIGTVTEDGTIPVEIARIEVTDGSGFSKVTTSKPDGSYQLYLPSGNYTVSVTKMCHQTSSISGLSVGKQTITTQNFVIEPFYCLILFPIYK